MRADYLIADRWDGLNKKVELKKKFWNKIFRVRKKVAADGDDDDDDDEGDARWRRWHDRSSVTHYDLCMDFHDFTVLANLN